MTNQKIGAFIAALRREQGLTQMQLAEKLGVSNRSVSRWENGNTLPDLSLMPELCAILEVRLPELLAGTHLDEAAQADACIEIMASLAHREAMHKARALSGCFASGGLLLLTAALLARYAAQIPNPHIYPEPLFWVLLCAGTGLILTGLIRNSRIHPSTRPELRILSSGPEDLRMKTAAEMIRFCEIHHRSVNQQQRKAFTQIAQALLPGESALFAFTGTSCTVNDTPGPWHISVAISGSRILLAGETMRGMLFPSVYTMCYPRDTFRSVSLQGQRLVLEFENACIRIDGTGLDTAAEGIHRAYL